jgi:hypothetical protein
MKPPVRNLCATMQNDAKRVFSGGATILQWQLKKVPAFRPI